MSPFAVLPVPAAAPGGRERDAPGGTCRLDALLTPPRPHPGPLVRPADVGGRAAWDVLVRDGALEVLRGDAAVVAGAVVTPGLRAGLLAGALPGGAVAAGRTAAWVHAGRAAGARSPDHLDVAYPAGGHRPDLWGAGLVWQAPLLRDDTVTLVGVRVTAPLRTVVDVAVHVPGDEDAALTARAVAVACDLDLADAAALLERRARVVGRPRARRVLARAAALRAASAALP
ncbi:hypothetical protein ACH436_03350 [Isoptericola sp. NPDC019693]|uniref:hypothetical protein n=1 Tax=Isoptericola sp. NPDC019693 TaxID=3364009 RepID=UPI00379C506A